jgi:DNA-binding NarL/FixJ family response regulator
MLAIESAHVWKSIPAADWAMQTMNRPTDHERIRLVLLDDHVLFRESLARLLAAEPGLEVVGECSTSSEGLEALNTRAVEVVLLSARSSHISREDRDVFICAARERGYQGKFLILTSEIDMEDTILALKRGAAGIFLESESSTRLIQAIRMVANGEICVDQRVVQLLANRCLQRQHSRINSLTNREQAVLEGILNGLTSKKIGERMGLSEATIKATLQRLFANAGVRRRSQLVRAVLEGTLRTGTSHPH